MSIKKSVSLLLSLLLIISVITATSAVTANADTVKHTITFLEEGYHAFRILGGGETERVTEAEAGAEIHISRHSDAPIEAGYYYTDGYLINGVLNYGSSFRMPDNDITVIAYKIKQSKGTYDLTSGKTIHCPVALHDHLLYDLSLSKDHNLDDQYYLIDLDDSGTYDIKLSDELHESTSLFSGSPYYELVRLDSSDANGKMTYELTSHTSPYNQVVLILSYDGITRYNITKPDYIRTYCRESGTADDVSLAEPGYTVRVSVYDSEVTLEPGFYFTGEITVNGVSLGKDDSGAFITDFVMPEQDVTVAALTAEQQPYFQNLSDGKPHEILLEFDTFFRYDEPVIWHGKEASYNLDVDNSGTDDIHCFTEYVSDENGDITDKHFYVQLLEGADVSGVITINRGGNRSEFSSVNFISVLCGDSDNDGFVTVMDATCIQRYLVGLSTNSFDKYCADANCNNEINIIDATTIQRRLAGYSD